MDSIRETWTRIAEWYKANAPDDDVIRLQPGATKADVEKLESLIGLSLPEAVAASYRIHNGSDGSGIFPFGPSLLSLEQIHKEWRSWCKALNDGRFIGLDAHPNGPIRTVWWNKQWIPITSSGGGDHQCVDMDPATGGRVGQIIEFYHETGPEVVLADGIGTWLTELSDSLWAGKYRFDEESSTLLPVDEEASS